MERLDLRDPDLAGEPEPSDIARGGDAVLVIGVDLRGRACAVRFRKDGPSLVRDQPDLAACAGARIRDDRIVEPRPVDIPLLQHVRAVVLGREVGPVIEELGRRASGLGGLVETACRIIAERHRPADAGDIRQPVVEVVSMGARAVIGPAAPCLASVAADKC